MSELLIRFFFFFQAEDGIRDKLVTGVQTCALPIYCGRRMTVATFPQIVRIVPERKYDEACALWSGRAREAGPCRWGRPYTRPLWSGAGYCGRGVVAEEPCQTRKG